MKYIKKPEVVEAECYTSGKHIDGMCYLGHGVDYSELPPPHVHTHYGFAKAVNDGDYIVKFENYTYDVNTSYVFHRMYEMAE